MEIIVIKSIVMIHRSQHKNKNVENSSKRKTCSKRTEQSTEYLLITENITFDRNTILVFIFAIL